MAQPPEVYYYLGGANLLPIFHKPTIHKPYRIIYLSEEAQLIIKETLRVQEELGIESEYLFPDENGEHVISQKYKNSGNP